MAQGGYFIWSEGDLLATELVRLADLALVDLPSGVVCDLSRDAFGDLGFFAVEPDVATTFGLLALEDDVAFHRYSEAWTNFER